MRRTGPLRAIPLALLAALLAPAVFAEPFRVVARTDESAPGTGPFATFASFELPCIDRRGRVAFIGTIQGPVLQGGPIGIWAEDGGFALRHPARSAVGAPGTGGDQYATSDPFSDLVWGVDGKVYFRAALDGAHPHGIFAHGVAIVLSNAPAPALPPGAEIVSLGPPVASSGGVAFRAALEGTGIALAEALYVRRGSQMQIVAQTGDPALSALIDFETFGDPRVTSDGRVGFGARTDTGVEGIWFERPSGVELVARSGLSLPGSSSPVDEFFDPSFNAAGDVLFGAEFGGAGAALWSGTWDGFARLVAWGYTLETFIDFRGYALDESGRVTFLVDMDNGDPPLYDSGIWAGTPGDLDPIVRVGDDAPGTNGAVFEGASPGQSPFVSMAVAPDGDFAFVGRLSEGDTTFGNDLGIWQRIDGELSLVARKGDAIEVAPGVFETLQNAVLLNSFGATSGLPSSMNARDQFAMRLSFQSGAAAIVMAPEPTASLLALAALGALGRARGTRSEESRARR